MKRWFRKRPSSEATFRVDQRGYAPADQPAPSNRMQTLIAHYQTPDHADSLQRLSMPPALNAATERWSVPYPVFVVDVVIRTLYLASDDTWYVHEQGGIDGRNIWYRGGRMPNVQTES